jgi:hypothetical protein
MSGPPEVAKYEALIERLAGSNSPMERQLLRAP